MKLKQLEKLEFHPLKIHEKIKGNIIVSGKYNQFYTSEENFNNYDIKIFSSLKPGRLIRVTGEKGDRTGKYSSRLKIDVFGFFKDGLIEKAYVKAIREVHYQRSWQRLAINPGFHYWINN